MPDYPFEESDEQYLRAIWNKALPVTSLDPAMWRLDRYFKPMKFTEYGNRNSRHGWEVDHIMPKSEGGTGDYSNLQPLNWQSNILKADGQLF